MPGLLTKHRESESQHGYATMRCQRSGLATAHLASSMTEPEHLTTTVFSEALSAARHAYASHSLSRRDFTEILRVLIAIRCEDEIGSRLESLEDDLVLRIFKSFERSTFALHRRSR